jgi:hypothetical protein
MEPPRKETTQDDLSLSLSLSLGLWEGFREARKQGKQITATVLEEHKGNERLVVQKHPTILSTSRIDKGAGGCCMRFLFSFRFSFFFSFLILAKILSIAKEREFLCRNFFLKK